MAIQINSSSEKVHLLADHVRDFGLLIGEVNDRTYVPGFHTQPGLGMCTEAKCFAALAKDLNEDLFKILVMGKFKNGKSTFVNAILGKEVMAANATATTAIIAMVEYGEHDELVRIYYTDQSSPETIPMEEFRAKYALTDDDQELIQDKGRCDRFTKVDHAVMQSHLDLFKDGIRLIDSPGLEEANARTKTTTEYVPRANAIVFTLSAPSLFSEKEKKYIADHFAHKYPRNVFFVVNRIDQLNYGQLESAVIPTVQSALRNVFTNPNGKFDEELFRKRVFYTNAYGALCARTGTPYKINIGSRSVDIDIDIAETGLLEFEQALSDFLNSDERLLASFQSTLSLMANTYFSAQQYVKNAAEMRQIPLIELQQRLESVSSVWDNLRTQANFMSNTIRLTGQTIAKKVFNSLLSTVMTTIPRDFEADVNAESIDFGLGRMLKIAGTSITANLPGKNRREVRAEQEQLLAPICDKIEEYIKSKLDEWQKQIPLEIEQDIKNLELQIGSQIRQFDMNIGNTLQLISSGNVLQEETYTASPLQTVFALSHGDLSLVVEGAATGGMAWSEYLNQTLTQAVINWVISGLFGSAILLPAVIIEAIGLMLSAERLPKKLLMQLAPSAFERLEQRVMEQELMLEEQIQQQFEQQGTIIMETANGVVKDTEQKLNQVLEERKLSEEENQKELHRQQDVLNELMFRFSTVFRIIYGRTPTKEDINRFRR